MFPAKLHLRFFQKSPLSPHVDINLQKLFSTVKKGAIELGLRYRAGKTLKHRLTWKTKL